MAKLSEEQILNFEKSKVDMGYINTPNVRLLKKQISDKLNKKQLTTNTPFEANQINNCDTTKVHDLTKSLSEFDEQINLMWNTSKIINRSESFRLLKKSVNKDKFKNSDFLYINSYLVFIYKAKLSAIANSLSTIVKNFPTDVINNISIDLYAGIKRFDTLSEAELKNIFVYLNYNLSVLLNLENLSVLTKQFSKEVLEDTEAVKSSANYIYVTKGSVEDILNNIEYLSKLSKKLLIENFDDDSFNLVKLNVNKDFYVFKNFAVMARNFISDMYMEKQYLTLKEYKKDTKAYSWYNTKYHFSNFKEVSNYFNRIPNICNEIFNLQNRLERSFTSDEAFSLVPYPLFNKQLSTLITNELRSTLLFEPLLDEEPSFSISFLSKRSLDNLENQLTKVTETLIEKYPDLPL